jgi:hypothetical protein
VGYLKTNGIGLSLTSRRPYKTLSGRQGIVMNSSGVRQNLARTGSRRIVRGSRRRDLNPQYLRTIGRIIKDEPSYAKCAPAEFPLPEWK